MSDLRTEIFQVAGMHCASCPMLIDEVLEDLDGVHRAESSLRHGRTVVELDPTACTPEAVISAIAEAGYAATPAATGELKAGSGWLARRRAR